MSEPGGAGTDSKTAPHPLSIVMPVFNEAAVIETVIGELVTSIVEPFDGEVNLVVVDDASTDGTPDILAALESSIPALQVHRQLSNVGHGASLISAIERSTGEWIFHIDSNRKLNPKEFWKLWDRRQDADLILGVRETRRDPAIRLLVSKITSRLVSRLAGSPVADPNSPFKLFRRAVWDELRPMMGANPFAPSIMLSLEAARRSSLIEVPVTHMAREHGRSTLVGFRLARAIIRAALQTARFSRRTA